VSPLVVKFLVGLLSLASRARGVDHGPGLRLGLGIRTNHVLLDSGSSDVLLLASGLLVVRVLLPASGLLGGSGISDASGLLGAWALLVVKVLVALLSLASHASRRNAGIIEIDHSENEIDPLDPDHLASVSEWVYLQDADKPHEDTYYVKEYTTFKPTSTRYLIPVDVTTSPADLINSWTRTPTRPRTAVFFTLHTDTHSSN
jgi:hypothetical protein